MITRKGLGLEGLHVGGNVMKINQEILQGQGLKLIP